MTQKTNEVLAALEKADGTVKVFPAYPQTFNNLPCISFYEADNRPRRAADDGEYLTEISFAVDLWGDDTVELGTLATAVVSQMEAIGFTRDFMRDVPTAGQVLHKAMRFKFIGG